MKFSILEGKQELLAKYGGQFKDRNSFDTIYNLIPANLKGYGDWVFKNVLEKGEGVNDLVDALNTFLKYKDRLEVKDINKYSSKEDVEKAIHYAEEKGSKKEKLYNAELVYEDEKVKVVRPLTHEASRHYGTGTKWCTATASPEHFDGYTKKGKLFYILPKDGEDDKYAIFSYTSFNPKNQKLEGFDKKDSNINPESIIKKFGLKKELFSAYVKIDASSKEGVKQFLDLMGVEKYTINEDLSVDVKGDVDISNKGLGTIPVKFGRVGGYFTCHSNRLTSLQGAPREVGGSFYCHSNRLTSLEGAAQKVGGYFYCSSNRLTSLEGAAQEVGGGFDCSYNKLTSLQGAPQKVGGYFTCHSNRLTSLQGSPQEVGGSFACSGNKLTSLEGSPQEVGGNFDCSYNPNLSEEWIEWAKRKYKKVVESVRKIKFEVVG